MPRCQNTEQKVQTSSENCKASEASFQTCVQQRRTTVQQLHLEVERQSCTLDRGTSLVATRPGRQRGTTTTDECAAASAAVVCWDLPLSLSLSRGAVGARSQLSDTSKNLSPSSSPIPGETESSKASHPPHGPRRGSSSQFWRVRTGTRASGAQRRGLEVFLAVNLVLTA